MLLDLLRNEILMKILNDYFEELYKNPHSKDFTFSLFLGMDAKFEREVIEVPSKKIFLNFSTYEAYDGMMF